MSHHLDSPLARQDKRLDISDVYLFRGTSGTVFVINVNPLSGTDGFHPEALYEFNIDVDGDAVHDITFRATFGAREADGRQTIDLRRLDGLDARDRYAAGVSVASGRTEEEITGKDGVRVWAGLAGDPFFIEGSVVTAVVKAVATGTPPDLGGWDRHNAANVFSGTNVSAIVIEVPDGALGTSSIGFWGTSVLPTDAGGWRQINRCAQPLVNTIFNPDDTERSSEYNTTQPVQDHAIYGALVEKLTADVVGAMGTHPDPAGHGRHVRDLLFPDILRYEIGTAAEFTVDRRNGRNLTDCTPEVMFRLVLNTPIDMGLDPGSATGTLRADFPYLSLPLPQS
ncbi:DUF4331 domain-containing protein [Nonomuraea longispora]|uniref:DUF4331 domain-containing protein n=1 Tax=Nonomuraea longispora TaxID=1848320 RepID=A0A4R4NQ25_9ACTN|nr:DUF4331 family protein [Nonomuraea longispora]TDC11395.1 DUF4331 domain-containing protein [Nonomuraea longispora]